MKKSLFILTIFIFAGCNTHKVTVDYDRTQNFSEFRTYSFAKTTHLGLSELDSIRLFKAIDFSLRTKGILPGNNPDLLVAVASEEYLQRSGANSSVNVGMGSGGRGIGGGISFGIPLNLNSEKLNQNFRVSMHNAKQNNTPLVWEGDLRIEMSSSADMEVKEKNIVKGIEKLFKNYPPAKK